MLVFMLSHRFHILNGCFFQTLPIFLDGLVTAWGAILISVTLILLFAVSFTEVLGRFGVRSRWWVHAGGLCLFGVGFDCWCRVGSRL